MGQTSSKTLQLPQQPIVQQQQSESLVQTVQSVTPGFGRAQTMLDVTQAQLASSTTDVAVGGLPRSTSDPALNTSSQSKFFDRKSHIVVCQRWNLQSGDFNAAKQR